MSPFIKCVKDRNFVTAAIMGGSLFVLKYLLSYRYINNDQEDVGRMKKCLL